MKYIPAIAAAALLAGFAAVGPAQAASVPTEALKTQHAQTTSVVEKAGYRHRKWRRHHRWHRRHHWWRPRLYLGTPRYYRWHSRRHHHRWHRRHHRRAWN